jgi:hypothetical protein
MFIDEGQRRGVNGSAHGGIGGLASAAFLHRQGLAATVYEQASRLTEVGAGLVVAECSQAAPDGGPRRLAQCL